MATVLNAADWIKVNGLNYIKLTYKGKSVFVYPPKSDKDENPTVEQAVSFFLANINGCESGYYTLIGRHNSAFGAGDLYFNFQHVATNAGASNAQISGLPEERLVTAITEKLTAQFEARLKDLKHEQEVTDLKKQIKEAKEAKNEFGLDKIGEVLGQVLEVGNMMKKTPLPVNPAISGPVLHREPVAAPQPVRQEQSSEQTARFGNAITAITNVTGENTIEAFEALARFAQENPDKFNTYLNMLKAQAS